MNHEELVSTPVSDKLNEALWCHGCNPDNCAGCKLPPTKLEQAARQALEALDEATSYTSCESWSPSMTADCNKAITALREALDHSGESNEMVIGWDRVKPEAIASDPLYQQGFIDGVEEGRNQVIEQAEQEPDYFGLTHDHTWLSIDKKQYDKLKPEGRMACYAAPQPVSQEPVAWIEGYPKDFYSEEWFIAITIYGDRVVLKALPENYSYDFTTADGTYMKKENVKRWMQFPDSEFLPPTVAAPVRTKDLTDEELNEIWYGNTKDGWLGLFRAVIAADREKNRG